MEKTTDATYWCGQSEAFCCGSNGASARRPTKRCLRPCTPPVRLFSVYSVHVQPSIRQDVSIFPFPVEARTCPVGTCLLSSKPGRCRGAALSPAKAGALLAPRATGTCTDPVTQPSDYHPPPLHPVGGAKAQALQAAHGYTDGDTLTCHHLLYTKLKHQHPPSRPRSFRHPCAPCLPPAAAALLPHPRSLTASFSSHVLLHLRHHLHRMPRVVAQPAQIPDRLHLLRLNVVRRVRCLANQRVRHRTGPPRRYRHLGLPKGPRPGAVGWLVGAVGQGGLLPSGAAVAGDVDADDAAAAAA
eukprot:scaffold3679_cov116-Isochrysis_galbana.AAC.4